MPMKYNQPNAWIYEAVRTPIGRYGGGLSAIRPDGLTVVPIKALLECCPNLDPADLDDVILGCKNQAGEGHHNIARMATLLEGVG